MSLQFEWDSDKSELSVLEWRHAVKGKNMKKGAKNNQEVVRLTVTVRPKDKAKK